MSTPGTPPGTPSEPSAEPPRYEPGPSVGKLMLGVLVFVLAALVVVVGGVYLS